MDRMAGLFVGLGVLSLVFWVVASPKFHRWHHTSEDEGLDRNFAGLLPVWDRIFGTYYMPPDRLPEVFGLKNESVPESFFAQLAYPFRRPSSGPA